MRETNNWNGKHIAISRTDSIGDVMLTLPMTTWLKKQFPSCKITFICRNYTAPIVSFYSSVDELLLWDELHVKSEQEQIKHIQDLGFDAVVHVFPRKELARLVKKAGVPVRIGTSHRLFHLTTCNQRVHFTRKKSPLHEAQLNFELLRPFGLDQIPSMEALNKYTSYFEVPEKTLPPEIKEKLHENYVILHPKSQGSAKEWPMEKYLALAQKLIERKLQVVFTGTEKEGESFRFQLPHNLDYLDSTGKLRIEELLVLIKHAKGLVACSTGPLHLAGFLGIRAVGIFSPKIPIHPGRWRPLGKRATTIVYDENCAACKAKKNCNCISDISVEAVLEKLLA